MALSADAPAPRLCYLIKWPDFDGYGFNLHAEKNKPGQFIGKVDEDSPAEAAGLRNGDRIIEVNNVNISLENHKQVVERIKAVPEETKLLVMDEEADKYYKERKIVVKNSQSNVVHIKTPPTKAEALENKKKKKEEKKMEIPAEVEKEKQNEEQQYQQVNGTKDDEEEAKTTLSQKSLEKESNSVSSSKNSTPKDDRKVKEEQKRPGSRTPSEASQSSIPKTPVQESPKQKKEDLNATCLATTPSPKPSPQPSPKPNATTTREVDDGSKSSPTSTTTNGSMNGAPSINKQQQQQQQQQQPQPPRSPVSKDDKLNLNMTAQEMRELIANRSRNRVDPKKEAMDLRQKHQIIQSM